MSRGPRTGHDGYEDLLAAIVGGLPRLPGWAACRDHLGLFDAAAGRYDDAGRWIRAERGAVAAAEQVCRACPMLVHCNAALVPMPVPDYRLSRG